VFDNDEQIIEYLTNVGAFKDVSIDDEEHEKAMKKCRNDSNNFKGNLIPRGVLTLEKLFDL
jgi:hypothetical protein